MKVFMYLKYLIYYKLVSVFCVNLLGFKQVRNIQTTIEWEERNKHINNISASFFLGWKTEFGGFTSYIAHDEDEEVSDVCFN